ncbi:MAG: sulfate reduction electron transfer complex DsrMKJOP subunit DsrP [Planctomycetota bacterium]
MLEKAFTGSRRYGAWVGLLFLGILAGTAAYLFQLQYGLGAATGLGRDFPWGLYIAQFTFMVGVAASAVMVVLPYYLHDYKAFAKTVVLGECLAISSVVACQLFIFVDMGQPARLMNVILYPTPGSIIFWDMFVLSGYLGLNLLIAWVTFNAERKDVPPPAWIKPAIILSIPWAVSIHTVTAFLFSGLKAHPYWMTAILAPRFLATAFAAGPALLILLILLVRRTSGLYAGKEAVRTLGKIIAYAMAAHVFFFVVEIFTALYGNIPGHLVPFQYLFLGAGGKAAFVPWMWASVLLSVGAFAALLFPAARENEKTLAWICVSVIIGIWIEKGFILVVAGFVPNPFGHLIEYRPAPLEILISLGVYCTGLLVLTFLCRIVTMVRRAAMPAREDA